MFLTTVRIGIIIRPGVLNVFQEIYSKHFFQCVPFKADALQFPMQTILLTERFYDTDMTFPPYATGMQWMKSTAINEQQAITKARIIM